MHNYKRSKYYAEATLNPQDIVEPIGYKFLNQEEEKKPTKPKKFGQAKDVFMVDKTLMRQISNVPRKEAIDPIKSLKITDSARKNYSMNGNNIQNLSKSSTTEMIQELREKFFQSYSSNQELIQYLELIILLFTNEYYLNIKDYALSTYFVYYHGENKRFYKQLETTLLSQFLEYEHEIIISSPKLSRPQLRKITNYQNVREIEEYIRQINEIGIIKDPFYTGLHLFISDTLPQCKSASFAQEEKQFWPFLQFTILVLMSTVAQGQNAIVRVKGTFTPKTCQYIFLLKLAFNRIYFQKNIISNPFIHDKYVICENFNKESGKIIAQYLIQNYGILFEHQDEKLLVDPKVTFTQDFQKNIMMYNDLTPIMKGTKDIANDYHQNNNINIYPNKEALKEKIGNLKIKNFNDLILQMEAIIPNKVEKKEEVKKEIVEKAAQEIDFTKFEAAMVPTKSKEKKEIHDISKQKKDEDIEKYIKTSNKFIQNKNEKSKKKKTEKLND